jgi:outer membrane protein assembly factor BamD
MFKAFLRYSLLILISLLIFNCSKFQKIQKSSDPQLKYDAALKYYQKKDYYRAGLLFEELVPIMRGKKESEIVELDLAYCNYYQKNLVLSAENFKNFYETYGRSQHVEEALYMYALSLYEDSPHYNLDQANTVEAINVAQSFINRYPESKYADKANTILIELRHKLEKKDYENAKMYHKVQNWKSAIIAFDNFQKNFPDSPYNEEVAFLKIESAYIYAKNSVQSKQEERYKVVVESYERFLDRYPDSKYLRLAEDYYKNSLDEVVKLAKK